MVKPTLKKIKIDYEKEYKKLRKECKQRIKREEDLEKELEELRGVRSRLAGDNVKRHDLFTLLRSGLIQLTVYCRMRQDALHGLHERLKFEEDDEGQRFKLKTISEQIVYTETEHMLRVIIEHVDEKEKEQAKAP